MSIDDEVGMLDAEIADLTMTVQSQAWELLRLKDEWEDTYPYGVLELALEAIRRLSARVFYVFPDDMETAELLQQMEAEISQALEEPEVFYLGE